MRELAKIVSTLEAHRDLTRPVEEITQVISAVIASQPHKRKEILEGLDLAVGNALAEIQAQEEKDQITDNYNSGKVS
ncbi:hypothetical protein P4H71_22885 [Paenibacillus kribbensis]|uniref:hypothetical protein n=1 Tax=Paenibacillus kribbensis TaxID=172713 RepID=UPI002DB8E44E|nr:hypothetical protein [Paenibacillus kribbensis]MEC0237173.1 hypothetical protein [Paenibacillus kribbensis]